MKNGISIILSVLLVAFIITGCKSGKANDSSNSSSLITSKIESKTESKIEEIDPVFAGFKNKPGEINFGGKKVIISSWTGESGPLKLLDDKSNLEAYTRMKMAETKYNCTFEMKVVSGEAYATQFASSAAAGIKFADIVSAATIWAFPSWIKNGFFYPLDEVIDYTSEKYSKQAELSKWIDGKHYYLTSDIIFPAVVAYNPDILEKEGCPDPLTLAQEGKWTWDALRDIAVKCTKNPNTANAQYGLKGWFVAQLLQSNGIVQIKVEPNKLTSGFFTDASLNTLNYYRDLLVTKKTIDPADWQIGNANFISGTVAMSIGELYSYADLRDKMSNFKLVPMPKGPDVEKYTASSGNIAFNAFSPLSDYKLADLVAVLRYGSATDDKTSKETYIDGFKQFKENSEKSKYFSSEEELNLYWDTMQEAVPLFSPGIDGNIMWKYIVAGNSNISLGENPSTVLEMMKNEVQADIANKMK
jgi:hypothetical protein